MIELCAIYVWLSMILYDVLISCGAKPLIQRRRKKIPYMRDGSWILFENLFKVAYLT